MRLIVFAVWLFAGRVFPETRLNNRVFLENAYFAIALYAASLLHQGTFLREKMFKNFVNNFLFFNFAHFFAPFFSRARAHAPAKKTKFQFGIFFLLSGANAGILALMNKTLVVEISGRRAGPVSARPTERLDFGSLDKIIVSNDSEGYDTEWPIVNVPDEFRAEFLRSRAIDNGWQAPMNRAFALEYARARGYRFVVQVDDNIIALQLASKRILQKRGNRENGTTRYVSPVCGVPKAYECVELFTTLLSETNAGVVGGSLAAVCSAGSAWLSERYCYSFFAIDLAKTGRTNFLGCFEDDIEFRFQLTRKGIPTIQLPFVRYSKTQVTGDKTGNRALYSTIGLDRGKTLRRLYGEKYRCGKAEGRRGTAKIYEPFFSHSLKVLKTGIVAFNGLDRFLTLLNSLLVKYAAKDHHCRRCSLKRNHH